MRICIIGNSHVGALKRAWDIMYPQNPQFTLTFFAMGSTNMSGLLVSDGKLIASNERLEAALEFTSKGLNVIDPSCYDVFVVYGMNAKASFIRMDAFYSNNARKQALTDLVDGTLSFETILKLRQITEKKIFVGHNPFRVLRKLSAIDKRADYVNGILSLNQLVYNTINCELLPQPIQTIVNGESTDMKYTEGSRKLAAGTAGDDQLHGSEDNFHMNDEFGTAWLNDFLAKLH